MEGRGLLFASILLVSLIQLTYGSVLFSSIHKTFEVTTTTTQGKVLDTGKDKITVTWRVNQSLPADTDSNYKTIKVKLCFAPVSQKDRPWRKTKDELKKDKTCQFKIVARPYTKSLETFEWTIERDVPTATYFVRTYAYDAGELEVAYGDSTNAEKKTNLFEVQAITGRHASLDIASVCFSAFSVLALAGFFIAEKRKAK